MPNVVQVQNQKKEWAEARKNTLPALMADFSELTKAEKETIAAVTSIANTCSY